MTPMLVCSKMRFDCLEINLVHIYFVIYIEPFLFFLFLTYLMASSLRFEFYCVELNPVDLLCQMFYECKFD